jgi:hypothetical protein
VPSRHTPVAVQVTGWVGLLFPFCTTLLYRSMTGVPRPSGHIPGPGIRPQKGVETRYIAQLRYVCQVRRTSLGRRRITPDFQVLKRTLSLLMDPSALSPASRVSPGRQGRKPYPGPRKMRGAPEDPKKSLKDAAQQELGGSDRSRSDTVPVFPSSPREPPETPVPTPRRLVPASSGLQLRSSLKGNPHLASRGRLAYMPNTEPP